MVVPVSSDKGLCGGINSTVVKYSKVVSGVAEGNQTSMTIVGEKARGQLSKTYADSLKNVVVDLSKVPLTFAAASLVTDAILAEGAQKHQIIYNRFQSVISFKPTVATVYSSDEYEKAAENGSIKFDEYEMEGPERSEFLLDLAEFNMGAVMYNRCLRTVPPSSVPECSPWKTPRKTPRTCLRSSHYFTTGRVRLRSPPSSSRLFPEPLLLRGENEKSVLSD